MAANVKIPVSVAFSVAVLHAFPRLLILQFLRAIFVLMRGVVAAGSKRSALSLRIMSSSHYPIDNVVWNLLTDPSPLGVVGA